VNEPQRTETSEPLPSLSNQRHSALRGPSKSGSRKCASWWSDDLLRDEGDISDGCPGWSGKDGPANLKRERQIAGMAIENIVQQYRTSGATYPRPSHSRVRTGPGRSRVQPQAIVLSGTLRDFDYYDSNPRGFAGFIQARYSRAGIWRHQLVGLSFGARVGHARQKMEQQEQREKPPG